MERADEFKKNNILSSSYRGFPSNSKARQKWRRKFAMDRLFTRWKADTLDYDTLYIHKRSE